MNTESISRIMAFPAPEMARLSEYRNTYGVEIPTSAKPDAPTIKCLLGHQDGQSGIIRAGSMPTTVSARLLTDGRYAVSGCWSLPLKAAWEAGDVQAEELTVEQLQSLTPQTDI